MRIVGGKYRGLILDGPAGQGVRPTTDRTRESLFNILEHGKFAPGGLSPLRGARVLDAHCGTGALGLEALSRGAAHATFIDNDTAALRLARANAKKLGEDARAEFIASDATKPPRAPTPCSVVFLDAPYGEGLTEPALKALAAAGWLAPDAIVIAEISTREDLAAPTDFVAADERRYGKAKLIFLRWRPT
jgi:16S rRNA (guanine966-N2)-methyltransferase